MWKVIGRKIENMEINGITKNGNSIKGQNQILNIFDNCYTEIGQNLANNIDKPKASVLKSNNYYIFVYPPVK